MSIVNVNTTGGAYAIHIAPNILQQLATSIPENASSIVLISNTTVMPLYGDIVKKSLAVTAKPLHVLELPDGEIFKNLETLNTIYTFLLTKHVDRKAVIVALGGGVIGDMCGYAAASYMRGIRFVQVPTTLLAQVDSSVGGKTAVNHSMGKNMIGAFYQPIAVDIDVNVLKTLPEREVSAGLAEVIKYGLILDADFFAWCEENVEKLRALDQEAITYAIHRSCELKAQVVNEDEKEIYIIDEHYQTGMFNEDIVELIKYKGYSKSVIVADSAEEKSIKWMKKNGVPRIKSSVKGPDSIMFGIKYLQGYKVFIHPKCKNFIIEIKNYVWDTDKKTGKSLNKPIDNYNHLIDAWRYSVEPLLIRNNVNKDNFKFITNKK